ncbi:hypothetical protein [Caproiciproducens sp.]|uniref:hypothetical protein n=1 Tax=Caproiciproducens sp. TaxID=1954376 RepID=UPI0028A0BA76|nr:hypothetical protein [Caproiciproducens sp.]
MLLTSKFAVLFGVILFILSCGTENTIGVCASALLIGFGTQAVIKLEERHV